MEGYVSRQQKRRTCWDKIELALIAYSHAFYYYYYYSHAVFLFKCKQLPHSASPFLAAWLAMVIRDVLSLLETHGDWLAPLLWRTSAQLLKIHPGHCTVYSGRQTCKHRRRKGHVNGAVLLVVFAKYRCGSVKKGTTLWITSTWLRSCGLSSLQSTTKVNIHQKYIFSRFQIWTTVCECLFVLYSPIYFLQPSDFW